MLRVRLRVRTSRVPVLRTDPVPRTDPAHLRVPEAAAESVACILREAGPAHAPIVPISAAIIGLPSVRQAEACHRPIDLAQVAAASSGQIFPAQARAGAAFNGPISRAQARAVAAFSGPISRAPVQVAAASSVRRCPAGRIARIGPTVPVLATLHDQGRAAASSGQDFPIDQGCRIAPAVQIAPDVPIGPTSAGAAIGRIVLAFRVVPISASLDVPTGPILASQGVQTGPTGRLSGAPIAQVARIVLVKAAAASNGGRIGALITGPIVRSSAPIGRGIDPIGQIGPPGATSATTTGPTSISTTGIAGASTAPGGTTVGTTIGTTTVSTTITTAGTTAAGTTTGATTGSLQSPGPASVGG